MVMLACKYSIRFTGLLGIRIVANVTFICLVPIA